MVKKHIHYLFCMSIYVAILFLFFQNSPSYNSFSEYQSELSEQPYISFDAELRAGGSYSTEDENPFKKEEERESSEKEESEEKEKEENEKEKDDRLGERDSVEQLSKLISSSVNYSISHSAFIQSAGKQPFYILFHSWKHFLS